MRRSNPCPTLAAYRLVESGRFQILSLDIFDTAVWRSFPTPADLFFALGHRLLHGRYLQSSSSPASFARERMEAEREARLHRGPHGEVTLEEIYKFFPSGYLRTSAAQVLREELALERESTHRDPEIFDLIELAKCLGMRVAFVSDTYFDRDHLSAILGGEAEIFPSSQYRRSKTQGLHRELIQRSGVNAGQILHIGDNFEADVEAPARLGVHTIWRPRFPSDFMPAFQAELPVSQTSRAAYLSEQSGDAGLTALRMQSSTSHTNLGDPFREWGSLVLGPTMAGLGKWALEKCREEGIQTVLCLMREGRVLKRVLDSFGTNVRTEEFFVSRYALLRASIFSGDATELTRFLARPTPSPVGELLAPLGIAPSRLGCDPDALLAPSKVKELAAEIARDPDLRACVRQASASTRTNFLQYLRQLLPNLPERIAVVDLGYSGTIQRHMQAIFEHEGIACQIHGLYLATGVSIRDLQSNGGKAEGYLAENGQPASIAHSFMRSPELVEQSLMCSLGSTIDYVDGAPVLGARHVPEEQLEEMERVQAGMLDFVGRFGRAATIQAVTASSLRPFLQAILIRAVTMPTAQELETFGRWVHDENLGSNRTRTLIDADIEPKCLEHASAHQLASLSSAVSYWIFGTAHRQHSRLGEAVRSIFLRNANAEAFHCPEDERKLHFFWNDGAAHRADSSYFLSSRRTAWSRFSLRVDESDLLEVGFSAGQPGDIINLAGIILRVHPDGAAPRTSDVPLAELQSFGTERVKGTQAAFLVTEIPGFVAAVSGIRNFTGRVDVDLLFSQMPTGELCPC